MAIHVEMDRRDDERAVAAGGNLQEGLENGVPNADRGVQAPSPRDSEHHPQFLFQKAAESGRPLFISAPMVRYSKLAFRALLRDYAVDLTYTPMIIAKEFSRHPMARLSDFTTNASDRPLVVQFGASSPSELATAAALVAPYCDGIDLNCGCPQSWAIKEGLGCSLMADAPRVVAMLCAAREALGPDKSLSVKIRVHSNLAITQAWLETVLSCPSPPTYITIHGRTRSTKSSEPANISAIKHLRSIIPATVPVVSNGDIFTLDDALRIAQETGCDAVMAARGLQLNPALFAGFACTPWSAVERFLWYVQCAPIPIALARGHLTDMLSSGLMTRRERAGMQSCKTWVDIVAWLGSVCVLRQQGDEDWGRVTDCTKRSLSHTEDETKLASRETPMGPEPKLLKDWALPPVNMKMKNDLLWGIRGDMAYEGWKEPHECWK